MSRLADHTWLSKYTPDDGNLIERFYIPALRCAVRYDRTTGYFSASALTLALRGLEGLIGNGGHMRLIVGCTLDEPEIAAILEGAELREQVATHWLAQPLTPVYPEQADALELLAWLVAQGILDVKAAVPCDGQGHPIANPAIFHEKAGILEDAHGDRLAFCGSLNETAAGWRHNWESFHVYTTWDGAAAHVDAEERGFEALWRNQTQRARTVDIPAAIRQALLAYHPPQGQRPRRLRAVPPPPPAPAPHPPDAHATPLDPCRAVWGFIHRAPALSHGERIGEATCAVIPWPHQIRAFQRLYDHWPPKLLIADEVGLGKTIQAGLLLRQAWLAGRARRILILAPKAVLKQWQIELREKFNLNWPIYDGQRLNWYPSPALAGHTVQWVSHDDWYRQPCLLASSHLLRRQERAPALLENAEPWDLIVLDEAHHARRRGGGANPNDQRPNQLLRLMQGLRQRTQGLILLTATPMQVHPLEVWDLLALLGLPPAWDALSFLEFFELAAKPSPSHGELARLRALFRAVEAEYGTVTLAEVQKLAPRLSASQARHLLDALHDAATIPLKQLSASQREAAVRLMKAHTPLRRLISRHTRELLRRYFQAGKLDTTIAQRQVEDRFVTLSAAERHVYTAVEDYIATTYQNAAADQRNAVGFVMTIYRRRLASSFCALAQTLQKRWAEVQRDLPTLFDTAPLNADEDLLDDDAAEDVMDSDEAARLEQTALAREEQYDLERLLRAVRALPTDTKARVLAEVIQEMREQGYPQIIVFTQYTDTLDFLRDHLLQVADIRVLCFSGRGGEARVSDDWQTISREETKRRFREGQAELLLCTDAAAEGLNFQFCGALVNYDMPWNPMRVEQRIGRIDRLGQRYPLVRIVNLHYEDTVETDVYCALRQRIHLFQTFVGRLQPILAKLPKAIADTTLTATADRDRARHALTTQLGEEVTQAEASSFDLDEVTAADLEIPERPTPLYDLADLNRLLQRPDWLPPGVRVKKVGQKDYAYLAPGMSREVRVTTDAEYFDEHPESTELWSPGSPLFPPPESVLDADVTHEMDFDKLMNANKIDSLNLQEKSNVEAGTKR